MLLSTHFEIVCQAKKVSSPLLLIENAFPRCTACALTFFSRRMCVFLFISHVKDVKFFVCREYDVGSNITIFCLLRMASVKIICVTKISTKRNYSEKLFEQYPTIKIFIFFHRSFLDGIRDSYPSHFSAQTYVVYNFHFFDYF